MKNVLLFVLLSFSVIACKSYEKMLQQGNYDEVIDRVIKKQLKGKADNDDKTLLDRAYELANQRDQSRIDFLKKEGKPENWEAIYRRYSTLSHRQEKVQKILPFRIGGKEINYRYIDYNDNIIEAKANAAKYFYGRGTAMMKLNTKEGYRTAYANFLKVKKYRPSDYPTLETLIMESRSRGISRVLIELDDKMGYRLPPEIRSELGIVNTSGLNTSWVVYDLAPLDRNAEYDYYITLIFNDVFVSPPEEEVREYIRRKEVEDGLEVVRDSRGKTAKDSTGKAVQKTKYKRIAVTVFETHQFMSATITGEVEFISANPDRLLKREPISGTAAFEHYYGRAKGNKDALEKEDWDLIKQEELPFPTDLMLIHDCVQVVNGVVNEVIHNNRNLIY